MLTDSKHKIKIANALKFNPGEDAAPQLIAKGVGLIAENIIKRAEQHDVPIYEDERLANQLKQLEIGDQIPYELYEVVAEVLVFIGAVDQKKAK
ncbi:MAG: EscU/YscU/HrcU family type III secretion system export apparatus switch protein [Firmicutes bacterium]|nr:EscU/YscU/HrcU family type III secretion system export apparatus switch protein [Bacillota bacterium]